MISGSSESATRNEPSPASTVALLWLDATGRVRSANASARFLWRVKENTFPSESFVSLLSWDITSGDPDWKQTRWDAIVTAARDGTVQLQAQPFGGGDAIPVAVALDEAHGPDPGYFAAIIPSEAPEATHPPAPSAQTAESTSSASTSAAATSTAAAHPGAGGMPVSAALNWFVTEAPVGFFDLDFKLGYAHYSPTWKRLLGYEDSDLPNTYETWQRLLHEDDSAAAPHQVDRNPGAGPTRTFALEFRMQHRRGHYVWMYCTGRQYFGPDSLLERVIGVQFDITDRKEIEEETLGSDERLRQLTSEGVIGAFDLDFVKRSHWFSEGWRGLFGLPASDPVRVNEPLWPLLDVLPTEHAQTGAAWLSDHRAGDDPVLEVITLKHRDGRGIPVLLGLNRHYSRRRELARVTGFALPLAIDAVSARLGRTLPPVHLVAPALDTLTEAVLVADTSGNVTYLNARAELLTGHTARGNGLLKIAQVLPLVRRSDSQPANDAIDIQLASSDPQTLCSDHALAPRPDRNEPLPIVWSARQVWDARGRIAGAVIVFRDPRELSLTPQEMLRTNRLETLAHLAQGIAADFNNLLTTILGALSQAKENRDLSHLASAEKACLDATGLSRQLLTFSRPTQPAGSAACSVAEIVHDAVRLAATGSLSHITLDLPDALPQIQGERSELVQVFQNLVLNAIDAQPAVPAEGVIRLRAQSVRLESGEVPPLPAGDYVQIEVQDNGCGIAVENLEHIFDPFFSTRRNRSGLGLATVQSIVHRHGGQVSVNSLPGAGATFTVHLPAVPRAAEVTIPPLPTPRFGTGRVLFMDDDPSICSLAASMLTSLDYTFDLVRNGNEAIALYRRYLNVGRPYDVVIMDINVVGGMGGEDCFAELLQLHPEVRAIAATGYDDPELHKRFTAMGFAGYLAKPYRLGDLSVVLKSVIGDPRNIFSA